MPTTIFYSWQSDLPNNTNRSLIERAIKKAIRDIEISDTELEVVLDRDTIGIPGTPSVADSIFEKIENCSVFIADVSFINNESTKPSPNPNVLLELGYAAKCIGWNSIILIRNTAYGESEDLPFDLRNRRWPISYSLRTDFTQAELENSKNDLIGTITRVLQTCSESGAFEKKIKMTDIRLALILSNALLPLQNSIRFFSSPQSHLAIDNFDNWQDLSKDITDSNRLAIQGDLLTPIIDSFQNNSIYSEAYPNGESHSTFFINSIIICLEEIEKALNRYPNGDVELVEFGYSLKNQLQILKSAIENHQRYNHDDIGIVNNTHLFIHLLISFISAKIIFGPFLGYC